MLIRYWMSQPVIHVTPQDALPQAISLMKENRIRQLPVVDKKERLAGIVSDRDLKRASASDATSLDVHELLYLVSKIKVADIMTRDVITVHRDWTIEEAADVLLTHKLSGLPVVDDDDRLCGIITQTDMFRATLYLTGLEKRGFHVALILEDTPGSIMGVVDLVRQSGGRMASILSTYDQAPDGFRNVYLRFYGVSRQRVDDLVAALEAKARVRYLIDHREGRRVCFDKG